MELIEFLSKSYTCYHAAELGAQMLKQAGFADIDKPSNKGKKVGYYRVAGGSLFAYKAGEGLNIVLAHTDSPSLRVRNDGTLALTENASLDVEKYGGGILRSFIDRKLKLAGRLIVKKGDTLESVLVSSDFNVSIPSLAIHLGGGSEELIVSRDLHPLIGKCENLYAALGYENAVSGDLYCVPGEEPFYSGGGREYLCSPRIDNLVSVYCAVSAIASANNKSGCLVACYDAEETGSETRYSAGSSLLTEFLSDCLKACGKSESVESVLRTAFAFSCDGAHALHPMRREKYGENAPVLGGGVVIKRNDRYATDALTEAVAKEIFGLAGVKCQTYYHHPDLRCGSTIGLISARSLGVATCDIGVGQLAMHSALETAALEDISALESALTKFFSIEVKVEGEKITVK